MRFRKKPVEVEAEEFIYTREGIERLKQFCGEALGEIRKNRHPDAKGEAQILTLEDGKEYFIVAHIATEGDFIIKGVQGEFYACKPNIFKETYEPVND